MMLFPDGAYHEIRHGLFEPTLGFAGGDWDRDVMRPWVTDHPVILAALRRAGDPATAGVLLGQEDVWALYALSRVAELLILPHQPPAVDPTHPADWLPASAYGQFVTALGGSVPPVDTFHPFLHEIVEVQPADDPDQPPTLVGQWWPGCFLGSLLLTRAGVTVRAGGRWLDPAVTTGSTLYWAWRRRYRPVSDPSHGWGGNSQWRTAFRRDYRLPDRLAYNVDAALDPRPEEPGGMPYNRDVDLLRYRCRTLVDDEEEQWVWQSHHTEPV